MIETRQLTKIFHDRRRGEIRAVNSLSLCCRPGQIYGLLGANGAGKTTALRMLTTLLKPTSGTAVVANYSIIEEPQKVRASVGFLSTATALYGRLTAREMIEYFGRLHGLGEEKLRSRVTELLGTLGMNEFSDRPCDKLSSGMKQKVSIARTLVHDPPVMIFDEPTVALDVLTARNIIQFIRNCRQNGKTIIFSTHVMSEAEKLCDRIGFIHNGRLLAEGTLAELQAQHNQTDLEEIFVQVVGGGS